MTPVIFCHIPSTAGLSFFDAIKVTLPPEHVYEETGDAPPFASLKDVSNLKLLRSHYTAHFEAKYATCFKITMLREPISRFLSHYGYRKMCIEERIDPDIPEMSSIESYISFCQENPTAVADMSQQSWIARFAHPEAPLLPPSHLFSDSGISECLELIDRHFALVAISNLFEESQFLFAHQFPDFPPFAKWNRNTLSRRHFDELDLPCRLRSLLEEVLWADIAFFNLVRTRFDAAFMAIRPGEDYIAYKADCCTSDAKLLRHLFDCSTAYLPNDTDLRNAIRKRTSERWSESTLIDIKNQVIQRLEERIARLQDRESARLKRELGLGQ